MMNGTAAADSSPPSNNTPSPSLPKLASPGWVTPPPILPPGSNDSERLARREANHHVYQCTGNQITWYHYVLFGYYQFDRVEDFHNAWNPAHDIESARYHIMWNTFHHHRMSNIPISPLLNMWANKHAKAYLHEHDPDFLLATEIIYDDSRDTDTVQTATPELAWTEIGRKNRREKSLTAPSSPRSTPFPSSPRPTSPITPTNDYYRSLQTDNDDVEMHDHDANAEVQIIEENGTDTPTRLHPISPQRNTPPDIMPWNQSHPAASTPVTTNQQTPSSPMIRLKNPYRSKPKPKNPAFAKQLRNYILARSPFQNSPTANNLPQPTNETFPLQTPDPHNTDSPLTTTVPTATAANPTKTHPSTQDPNHTTNQTIPTPNSRQPPDPFVLINDGTQRLTIRWRPEPFNELASNPHEWDHTLMLALRNILNDHTDRTAIVKWGEQHTPDNNVPLDHLTPETIRQYLSPNISVLTTNKTFIFGIRLCAPDNHLSAWITRESTRETLKSNNIELTISNSKSSSGNVVTAGYILMKHPVYTQRYFFLLSLRKALPPNTPFFDLAVHRRTPHGDTTPHLVVKCGENHLTGLSEILSAHLDGTNNNTALFVASQAVKSMTHEEMGKMFEAHTTYVDNIQRLPLHPKVINIDRARPEYSDGITVTRSTREWARTLKTTQGHSLRCDVENGGPDRRAYLLVLSQHLDQAKIALHQYLQALNSASPSSTWNLTANTQVPDPKRPTEIYIPTPAVMNNLNFLNTLTSSAVWQSAPKTVRSPPAASTTPQPPPPYKHPSPTPPSALRPTHQQSPSKQSTNNHSPSTRNSDDFPPLHTDTRQDDTTVGSTTSNFTRTTHQNNQSVYNSKFQDLEDQIKNHNQEFKAIHNRFDTLNEQILRNMQIASDQSRQFSHMERQFNDMNTALQTLLQRSIIQTSVPQPASISPPLSLETQTQDHRHSVDLQHLTTTPETTYAATPAGSSSQSIASASNESSISIESQPISSPEKKRIRSHDHSRDQTSDGQEQSAQYNNSTPAADPDL